MSYVVLTYFVSSFIKTAIMSIIEYVYAGPATIGPNFKLCSSNNPTYDEFAILHLH